MTSIEWTDATWNPIVGCSIVSPGCTNCYAMKLAGRRLKNTPKYKGLTQDSKAGPVWNGKVRLWEKALLDPLRWHKGRKIFVNSEGDLFHEAIPDEWIDRVFAVMEEATQHTYQILTKRAARQRDYMVARYAKKKAYANKFKNCPTPEMRDSPAARWARAVAQPTFWKNIWLGVSAERQQEADERIPLLLQTPAAVRFISAEPLLGPIDLWEWLRPFVSNRPDHMQGIKLDWVIVGGESGPKARPMHPEWARKIIADCEAAGVAKFFKQWGEWQPGDGDCPQGQQFYKIGKKKAGRLLDGREHNEFPQTITAKREAA